MPFALLLASCGFGDPCSRPAEHLWCDLFIAGGSQHCRYAAVAQNELTMTNVGQRLQIHYLRKKAWPTQLRDAFGGEAPRDPWGSEYTYEALSDGTVRLTSLGAHRVVGGACEEADVARVLSPLEIGR